jgi:hypothetical protein
MTVDSDMTCVLGTRRRSKYQRSLRRSAARSLRESGWNFLSGSNLSQPSKTPSPAPEEKSNLEEQALPSQEQKSL